MTLSLSTHLYHIIYGTAYARSFEDYDDFEASVNYTSPYLRRFITLHGQGLDEIVHCRLCRLPIGNYFYNPSGVLRVRVS